MFYNAGFFVRFGGNSFCPKMAKFDFLPWNSIFSPENSNFRQFWANSTLQNIIWHKNLHGVTLFIAFLLSKFMGKGENLYLLALTYKILKKTKKLLFRKGETRFQNVETRFQNVKTAFISTKWDGFRTKKPSRVLFKKRFGCANENFSCVPTGTFEK